MTDPQTMQEIKDALAAGPGGVSVARDPGIFTTEKIDEKPRGLKQLFTRDELIPLKGVWFKAVEVEEGKLVLKSTHFTRNFAKRNR